MYPVLIVLSPEASPALAVGPQTVRARRHWKNERAHVTNHGSEEWGHSRTHSKSLKLCTRQPTAYHLGKSTLEIAREGSGFSARTKRSRARKPHESLLARSLIAKRERLS